jgi:hypothetical protein
MVNTCVVLVKAATYMKQERLYVFLFLFLFFSEWKQLTTGKTVVNFCNGVKENDKTKKVSASQLTKDIYSRKKLLSRSCI